MSFIMDNTTVTTEQVTALNEGSSSFNDDIDTSSTTMDCGNVQPVPSTSQDFIAPTLSTSEASVSELVDTPIDDIVKQEQITDADLEMPYNVSHTDSLQVMLSQSVSSTMPDMTSTSQTETYSSLDTNWASDSGNTQQAGNYFPNSSAIISNEADLTAPVDASMDIDVKPEVSDEMASNRESGMLLDVTENQPAELLYSCKYCGQHLKHKLSLKKHEEAHRNGTIYKCRFCNYHSTSRAFMEGHESQHTGVKLFQCTLCDHQARYEVDLRKHRRVHFATRSYPCHLCPFRSKWKGGLDKHLLTHSSIRRFSCHLCAARFKRKSGLKTHMTLHSSDKPFQCDQCSYSCRIKSMLKMHLRTHSDIRNFICTYPGCSQRCKTKSDLTKHSKIHTDKFDFLCKMCGKTFKTRHSLTCHMKRHGEKEMDFSCSLCGKKLGTRFGLKKHMIQHFQGKKYACPVCGHKFFNLANMKRHILVHDDNKPFACPICKYYGDNVSVLLTHIGSVHGQDYTYFCELCRRPFPTVMRIKLHVQRCHPGHMIDGQCEFVYNKKCCEARRWTNVGPSSSQVDDPQNTSEDYSAVNHILHNSQSMSDMVSDTHEVATGSIYVDLADVIMKSDTIPEGSPIGTQATDSNPHPPIPTVSHNSESQDQSALCVGPKDFSGLPGNGARVKSLAVKLERLPEEEADRQSWVTDALKLKKANVVSVDTELNERPVSEVINIGSVGDIGVCLTRKDSDIEFNLEKRGVKTAQWRMIAEHMTNKVKEKKRSKCPKGKSSLSASSKRKRRCPSEKTTPKKKVSEKQLVKKSRPEKQIVKKSSPEKRGVKKSSPVKKSKSGKRKSLGEESDAAGPHDRVKDESHSPMVNFDVRVACERLKPNAFSDAIGFYNGISNSHSNQSNPQLSNGLRLAQGNAPSINMNARVKCERLGPDEINGYVARNRRKITDKTKDGHPLLNSLRVVLDRIKSMPCSENTTSNPQPHHPDTSSSKEVDSLLSKSPKKQRLRRKRSKDPAMTSDKQAKRRHLKSWTSPGNHEEDRRDQDFVEESSYIEDIHDSPFKITWKTLRNVEENSLSYRRHLRNHLPKTGGGPNNENPSHNSSGTVMTASSEKPALLRSELTTNRLMSNFESNPCTVQMEDIAHLCQKSGSGIDVTTDTFHMKDLQANTASVSSKHEGSGGSNPSQSVHTITLDEFENEYRKKRKIKAKVNVTGSPQRHRFPQLVHESPCGQRKNKKRHDIEDPKSSTDANLIVDSLQDQSPTSVFLEGASLDYKPLQDNFRSIELLQGKSPRRKPLQNKAASRKPKQDKSPRRKQSQKKQDANQKSPQGKSPRHTPLGDQPPNHTPLQKKLGKQKALQNTSKKSPKCATDAYSDLPIAFPAKKETFSKTKSGTPKSTNKSQGKSKSSPTTTTTKRDSQQRNKGTKATKRKNFLFVSLFKGKGPQSGDKKRPEKKKRASQEISPRKARTFKDSSVLAGDSILAMWKLAYECLTDEVRVNLFDYKRGRLLPLSSVEESFDSEGDIMHSRSKLYQDGISQIKLSPGEADPLTVLLYEQHPPEDDTKNVVMAMSDGSAILDNHANPASEECHIGSASNTYSRTDDKSDEVSTCANAPLETNYSQHINPPSFMEEAVTSIDKPSPESLSLDASFDTLRKNEFSKEEPMLCIEMDPAVIHGSPPNGDNHAYLEENLTEEQSIRAKSSDFLSVSPVHYVSSQQDVFAVPGETGQALDSTDVLVNVKEEVESELLSSPYIMFPENDSPKCKPQVCIENDNQVPSMSGCYEHKETPPYLTWAQEDITETSDRNSMINNASVNPTQASSSQRRHSAPDFFQRHLKHLPQLFPSCKAPFTNQVVKRHLNKWKRLPLPGDFFMNESGRLVVKTCQSKTAIDDDLNTESSCHGNGGISSLGSLKYSPRVNPKKGTRVKQSSKIPANQATKKQSASGSANNKSKRQKTEGKKFQKVEDVISDNIKNVEEPPVSTQSEATDKNNDLCYIRSFKVVADVHGSVDDVKRFTSDSDQMDDFSVSVSVDVSHNVGESENDDANSLSHSENGQQIQCTSSDPILCSVNDTILESLDSDNFLMPDPDSDHTASGSAQPGLGLGASELSQSLPLAPEVYLDNDIDRGLPSHFDVGVAQDRSILLDSEVLPPSDDICPLPDDFFNDLTPKADPL